jgi:hypothetical protein
MFNDWEARKANFLALGLTLPGLESTIYHTQGERTNHYTNIMKSYQFHFGIENKFD